MIVMLRKRGIFIGLLLLTFVGSSFFTIFKPQQVLAATETDIINASGTWVNKATISVRVGSNTFNFFESNLGDQTLEYVIQDYPCHGTITLSREMLGRSASGPVITKTGGLDMDYLSAPRADGTTDCSNTSPNIDNLPIGSTDNYDIEYVFTSATQIKRADGHDPFTQSSTYPKLYVAGNSKCADVILISDGGGTLYDLTDKQPTRGPQHPNAPPEVHQSGCYVARQSNIKLGGTASSPVVIPGSGSSSTNAPGDENPTCETNSNPLTWLLCPVFNGIADLTDWLFETLVEPLLYVSPVSTNSDDPSYQVWSGFRVFGNILLIIALIVLVFGQAIGGGLIDAYTAKKMMPRILTAAILVNLSVYIVALMVDVVNVVAAGLGQLMITPVRNAAQFTFTPNGVQSSVGAGTGLIAIFLTKLFFAGAAVKAALFIGIFVLLPALLSLIGAFVTMVIRQGLILFLIVVSPIAFALYALPNTEKYFKKWWELLFKTLLVYPIVIAIFAIADIMTVMIASANGFDDKPLLTQVPANVLAGIIAFVVQFLPLVLIPFAFKFAGGLIGTLYTTLSGYGKSTSEAIKGSINDPNSLRNKTRANLKNAQIANASDRMAKWRSTTTDRDSTGAYKNGALRRRAAHLGMRGLGITDWDRKRKDQNELFDKEISGKTAIGADTLERAFFAQQATGDHTYTDYNGVERKLHKGSWYSPYRDSDGTYKEVSAADVANSHKMYDGNESKIQTLIKYESGKIGNDQDFYGVDSAGKTIYDPQLISRDLDTDSMPLGSFMGNLPTVMTKAGLSPNSSAGSSIGSFFATQAQRRELKHTKPDGKGGWKRDDHALVQDWAENVGSYGASTSKTSPIESLADIHAKFKARQERVASGNAQALREPDGTAILNPDGTQAYETWNERDKISMQDFQKIAAGLDTSRRAGQIGTVTEDGQPIDAGSGAPGRVNDAIQRLVRQVGGG